MKLLLILFIIFIYIFLFYNNDEFVYIEDNFEGTRYLVQKNTKEDSLKILTEITKRLYSLRNYLVNNISIYPQFKEYILRLKKGFNHNRTTIMENSIKSETTSYNINKGEEIVFCLKSKKTGKIHDINLLTYVAIHEIAHIACPDIGHGDNFQYIFKFFIDKAIELKLYSYVDYNKNPTEYCGMMITN
jgi:predicted metal-dependent hydrolase